MVKTTIKETTEKYDKDGKLLEKITREETTEDDSDYSPTYITQNYETFKPAMLKPGCCGGTDDRYGGGGFGCSQK